MKKTHILIAALVLGCCISSARGQQTAARDAELSRTCVAVIGAVHQPLQLVLWRPTRLMEALTFAGGPTAQAGATVMITRTGSNCSQNSGGNNASPPTPAQVQTYLLSDILHADQRANPYLEGGDVVTVYEAECVFIVGAVAAPRQMFVKGRTTLTDAITFAGGVLKDARVDTVSIIRQGKGAGERVEFKINLEQVRKHRAKDLVLQPNDIIDVPFRDGHRGPMFSPPTYDAPVKRPPVYREIYLLQVAI